MTDLFEEVEEYFEDLFKRKELDLCDLKLIKDFQNKLLQEERTVDSIFVDELEMLY